MAWCARRFALGEAAATVGPALRRLPPCVHSRPSDGWPI